MGVLSHDDHERYVGSSETWLFIEEGRRLLRLRSPSASASGSDSVAAGSGAYVSETIPTSSTAIASHRSRLRARQSNSSDTTARFAKYSVVEV